MSVHTFFGTYTNRYVFGCLLLFAAVIALLCYAVLSCARGSTTTYTVVHSTAVRLLLHTGTAIPPAALIAHTETYIGMTRQLHVVKQMVHHFTCKQKTCKCQELHAPGKQTGCSMHVRTYFYSSEASF